MKNKKYQHLFFDLDHTLWDFDKNASIVLSSLFEELKLVDYGIADYDSFEKIYKAENDRMWLRYRNGFIKQAELRIKRFTNTFLHFKIVNQALAEKMNEQYMESLPQQVALLPHALEVLDYCKAKDYRLHIITNGFEEVQYKKLKFSGLQPYFEQIITSEKSMRQKPHKEIFDYALNATGAEVSNSIMIGDNWEADILGAKDAGWAQVYFNPQQLTQDIQPTYDIQCLSSLKEIF